MQDFVGIIVQREGWCYLYQIGQNLSIFVVVDQVWFGVYQQLGDFGNFLFEQIVQVFDVGSGLGWMFVDGQLCGD